MIDFLLSLLNGVMIYFCIGLLVYIYHCFFWPDILIFGVFADMFLMITTWPFGIYVEIHNWINKE